MVNLINEVKEVNLIFQDIEHQLQKHIFYHFLHYSFLLNPHYIEKYLLFTQNYSLEAFVTLCNHINYLHPNIEGTTIF